MKKYFVANLKMELSLKESLALLKKYSSYRFDKRKKIIVCPDYLCLAKFKNSDKNIQLGAQNCAYLDKGALTGEISPQELSSLNVNYVILGHSERRFLNENNLLIAKKVKAALDNNLKVILCVGETKEEKNKKFTKSVIKEQINSVFSSLSKVEMKNIILAYEPRWAIGQKKPCLASQAALIHQFIKEFTVKKFNIKVKVIYGGSVNQDSLIDFDKEKSIDGFLVGRASLDFNQFKKIVNLC